MSKAIIAVTGTIGQSKKFVARARWNGYECQKINPERATREIVRVILPRGHARDAEFFAASRDFIKAQEAEYPYIEKKLQNFFFDDVKQVAILVNISSKLLRILESDFEAFSVLLSESDGVAQAMSSTHDYTIFDNDGFNKETDKLLRVLTKDMSNQDEEDAASSRIQ